MCVCYKVFDHNGDGYISKLELHKTMNEFGIELTREDLDAMMDEADVNKDGRIDYAGQLNYHYHSVWRRMLSVCLQQSHVTFLNNLSLDFH